MDLLVVGGSGLLGREVVAQARRAGAVVAATFYSGGPGSGGDRAKPLGAAKDHAEGGDRAEPVGAAKDHAEDGDGVAWHRLDITDRGAVARLLQRTKPAAVVNAAYRQADWATTADGAMHVAAAAAAAGARLVHVSSDAVFSGRSGTYDESCPPCPGTVYGAAKAAAETAVKGLDPDAVIVRTSLIVGDVPAGRDVVAQVHALARGDADGVLFTDDVRCPIGVGDLAAALLGFAASPGRGIRHIAGGDALSRYALGLLIARRDGLDVSRLRPGLRAGTGLPGALDVRLVSAIEGVPGSSARLAGS
jgi:dTDP-4-dehydrorhamnose reductase